MWQHLDFSRGFFGAVGGFAAGVVLTLLWIIFVVVAFVGFSFSLGTVETAAISVVVVGGLALVIGIVQVSVVAVVLWMTGSSWAHGFLAGIAGAGIAVGATFVFREAMAFAGWQSGRPIVDLIAPLIILAAGCPVMVALALGRTMPLPGLIVVGGAMPGMIALLSFDVVWPQAVALAAWVILPALGGFTGGPASLDAFPFLRRMVSAS